MSCVSQWFERWPHIKEMSYSAAITASPDEQGAHNITSPDSSPMAELHALGRGAFRWATQGEQSASQGQGP